MATRILGLDIGSQSIKATIVEAHLRRFEVQQCVVQRVPTTEEAAGWPVPASVTRYRDRRKELAALAGEAPAEPVIEEEKTLSSEEPPAEPIPPLVYALDRLLSRPGVEYDEVVCSISGNWVATRILQLPFSGRAKIAQVLPMTIEDEVPFDMDEMMLGSEILDSSKKGSTVLAAMAKRDDLARFLTTLEMGGIEPKALTMTGSALSVTARLALAGQTGAFAVLDIGDHSTDVVILKDGRLVQVRSIPEGGQEVTANLARLLEIPADKAEELKVQAGRILAEGEAEDDARVKRLSDALQEAHQLLVGRVRQTIRSSEKAGGFKVDAMLVTGGASRLRGLSEYLAAELDVRVEPFNPLAGVTSLVEATDEVCIAHAVSIGLAAWTTISNRHRAVNFRTGALAFHKVAQQMQGSLKGAAVMAGIVLALFVVIVLQSRGVQNKRVAALDQQARKIYLDTFSQQPPPGNIVQSFKTQADQVINKYKVIGYLGDGNTRALDVIRAMSQALSQDTNIEVSKLDLKSDFVKLEAYTDKFESVNKIETELGKSELFKSVNREDAKKAPGDKIKFKLTLQLTRKEKGASGVATLFGGGNQPAQTPVIPGSEP